jgi:hypothetical protein
LWEQLALEGQDRALKPPVVVFVLSGEAQVHGEAVDVLGQQLLVARIVDRFSSTLALSPRT